MMSALPQVGPLGGLLNKGAVSAFGSFEYDQKESRDSYDMDGGKKKRRAPAPPSGLGQYKPKILSAEGTGNVAVTRADDSPVPPPRPSRSRGPSRTSDNDVGGARPMVMGDKDMPMVIPSEHDLPQDVDLNVSSLNLTSHDLLSDRPDTVGTDNPLFSIHDENPTATQPQPTEHPLFSMHDENLTVPQAEGNPLFNVNDEARSSTAQSPVDSFSNTRDQETVSSPQRRLDSDFGVTEDAADNGEPEDVYIPAPDYEEEEMTMAIAAEEPDEDQPRSPRRRTQVFKEYDGEDFGQYLSDEENGYDDILRNGGSRMTPNFQTHSKSKTEVRRPQSKKRESLPTLKNKKDKDVSGYSSLRTFSYADSKFGTVSGNRNHPDPLSRSSAGDRKKAELFVNTGSSYEQFLYGKNGEDPPPPARGDLGYSQEASAGYPAEQSQKKDSVWKKLTWKMKKQTNSFDLTASS